MKFNFTKLAARQKKSVKSVPKQISKADVDSSVPIDVDENTPKFISVNKLDFSGT